MTASHPQYFIVTDSISPHSNSQLLTAIHCDEPNTGFEPRLISAHFFARWSGWRLPSFCLSVVDVSVSEVDVDVVVVVVVVVVVALVVLVDMDVCSVFSASIVIL